MHNNNVQDKKRIAGPKYEEIHGKKKLCGPSYKEFYEKKQKKNWDSKSLRLSAWEPNPPPPISTQFTEILSAVT